MIKQIKHILLEEPLYPRGYGRLNTPEELQEHNIWRKIMDLCNLNSGKYLKHFIEHGWVKTDTPPHISSPEVLICEVPTGIETTYLNLFMEIP